MEPGAAAAVGPGELLQALLEGAGGRGRVLLVAELWEREQSRNLMRGFARHVFPQPEEEEEDEAEKEEEEAEEEVGSKPGGPQELAAETASGNPGGPQEVVAEEANGNPGGPQEVAVEEASGNPRGSQEVEAEEVSVKPGDPQKVEETRASGRGPPERAIRSPLVFVLCREASLRASEPRLRLREILRDVRARRRQRPRWRPRWRPQPWGPAGDCGGGSGAALVGVLVEEPGGGRGEIQSTEEGSEAEAMHLLEALLRSVFGRDAGGPVQAASYCPARPASAADVQSAACRALRAAAGQRPPAERMRERMGFQRLLRCLPWSSWSRRKDQANSTTSSPAEAGIISLLDEEEPQLKEFALQKLNAVVNDFWAEISESVDKIEVLYEDEGFRSRQFAALVASKVFYHLGAFEESLNYALGAGDLFNVNDNSEYVETIIAKCIDHYTKQCVENAELPEGEKKPVDERLEGIVNKMFQRCLDDHKYKQAIGIALETRRLDVFEKTILESSDVPGMLAYSLKLCMSLMQNKQFRNRVLRVLVKIYMNLEKPDFINVCQCLIFLDDPQAVSDILEKLVKEDNLLMAYQICFDLYESASQQFLSSVIQNLRTVGTPIASVPGSTNTGTVPGPEKESDSMETEEKAGHTFGGKSPEVNPEPKDQISKMIKILSGEMAIELHLQFLIRNNNTDLMILKNTKDAVRNSVCHTATVIANSFMHCGTTSDQFLRDNLEWLARATNWAKFTATASLGVIHKGHEKEALQLMATYLPKDTSPGSAYQEGGGLYALGLIHANHGGDIIDYLLNQLKNASNDIVRHGGSLGLGLAAMGTARQDVYDLLKTNLYQDDAVTGEAAGLALGLVMLGSKNAQAIEDMVGYAQETQHEKILRGLAVGIALVMYGRMEEADALIESLCRDKDPILRRSGMYTVAMAYCGSGNNRAIRRLLHVAVSDVNDDVRRAAVESLGFILFRTPEQCPSVVSLLSESYNPHVRYGAAMALGICCAGTGNKEAINLLEPMTNDPVNYVRQGALIASALIMIQQTEITCPKVNQFRQLYSKVINDKHDDVMAKFGAILAQGILDAGGHNVTISLQSRTGHTHMPSVVGVLVFTQFWFWFPLSHFLSLAYTPTCVIGLNKDLKMPKVQYKSNCKPSTFAYPAPLEVPKEKEKEKVSTAVLSITAKAKKKEKEKEKKEEEKMEVDETEKKDEKEKKKEPEPSFQLLDNPARVMPAQLKVLSMTETCRYQPFKPLSIGGHHHHEGHQ
uniref:26S proteasome non-ATPase regulatory subunit 1 n=1 Tax=Monodelphis domestica TaxID=13616 RepID=K7DZZ0_MONDO